MKEHFAHLGSMKLDEAYIYKAALDRQQELVDTYIKGIALGVVISDRAFEAAKLKLAAMKRDWEIYYGNQQPA